MAKRRTDGEAPHPAPAGDLGRLIETEQRLEARLAEAAEEARRLVEAARAAAFGAEEAMERELQEAAQRLEAEIEADRRRQAEAIAAEARRQASAFEHVTPRRVAELARYVVDRVVAAGSVSQ